MSAFDTMLAGIWLVLGLLVLCVTLVYIWARRFDRWRNARWWTLLLFSVGVTKVVGNLVTAAIAPPDGEEIVVVVKDLLIGAMLVSAAWAINARRLRRG